MKKKETHNINWTDNFIFKWKNEALIVNIYSPKEYTEGIEL